MDTAMSDQLQHALKHVDELPPDTQEHLAEIIERHIEPMEPHPQTLAGAWSDLPDTFEEMLDALDRIRHAHPQQRSAL
jgi:hypothetical protein